MIGLMVVWWWRNWRIGVVEVLVGHVSVWDVRCVEHLSLWLRWWWLVDAVEGWMGWWWLVDAVEGWMWLLWWWWWMRVVVVKGGVCWWRVIRGFFIVVVSPVVVVGDVRVMMALVEGELHCCLVWLMLLLCCVQN